MLLTFIVRSSVSSQLSINDWNERAGRNKRSSHEHVEHFAPAKVVFNFWNGDLADSCADRASSVDDSGHDRDCRWHPVFDCSFSEI